MSEEVDGVKEKPEVPKVTKIDLIRSEIKKNVNITEQLDAIEVIDTKKIATDVLYVLGSDKVNLDETVSKQEILDELKDMIAKESDHIEDVDFLKDMLNSDEYMELLTHDETFINAVIKTYKYVIADIYELLTKDRVPWPENDRHNFTL